MGRHSIARILVVGVLSLVGALSWTGLAYADVNQFVVTNLAVDYYLTNADLQGEMRIVEKFSVNFSDQNHGILRAIPKDYKNRTLNIHINAVTSDSGAPATYTSASDGNGNEVLKIGDKNTTVTGIQEYTVDYTVQHVVTFYTDHDELYWNVNGVYWDQPFREVKATIHLPSGVKLAASGLRCFTGSQGSRSADCTIASNASAISVATTKQLDPNQTLTFVLGLQQGYFQPATWVDKVRDYGINVALMLVPFLLLSGIGYVRWFKHGRDVRGTGIIVPQYDAPDRLRPAEVGVIMNFKANQRDFTATIIDLAIRKYVRIIETDSQMLFAKSKQFSLQIVNTDLSKLTPWEAQIMAALIAEADANQTVLLSQPNSSLQKVLPTLQKSLDASLTERNYFAANPHAYMVVSLSALIIIALVATLQLSIVSPFLAWGTAAGAVVFAVFFHFMPARTVQGVAAKEHILGLKMYLNIAEKDRLATLQSPDAPYAAVSSAPVHTVDLFEKLLPYAIVLEVEAAWAKSFQNIYTSPPDWYVGNYTAFNAGYLVGSLQGGFTSAVTNSFGSASSSTGSGFGGGGFSGGGGGGGGGGGW